MVGINQFFKETLGYALPNTYSWGCFVPARNAMCLTIWSQEISNGRVFVHQDEPIRQKDGHVNRNWTARKLDMEMVHSGVATFGVLISNGDKSEDSDWKIHDLNDTQIFKLTHLQCDNNGIWSMKVDLCNPEPVRSVKFDVEAAEAKLVKYPLGMNTVGRARKLKWELIGLTDSVATLMLGKKLMTIDLDTGKYNR